MVLAMKHYRLTRLDGTPHPILDAPYESIEDASLAAKKWCEGQGLRSSINQNAIGIEVLTLSGAWRTVKYQINSIRSNLTGPYDV